MGGKRSADVAQESDAILECLARIGEALAEITNERRAAKRHKATLPPASNALPSVFKTVRDLSPFADILGRYFGFFVNSVLDVNSLVIEKDQEREQSPEVFGEICGALLTAFIRGTPIKGDEFGDIRSILITGAKPSTPINHYLRNIQELIRSRRAPAHSSEDASGEVSKSASPPASSPPASPPRTPPVPPPASSPPASPLRTSPASSPPASPLRTPLASPLRTHPLNLDQEIAPTRASEMESPKPASTPKKKTSKEKTPKGKEAVRTTSMTRRKISLSNKPKVNIDDAKAAEVLTEHQEQFKYLSDNAHVDYRRPRQYIRKEYGAHFVTVKELARVLLARPWRALVSRSSPFRILKIRPGTNTFKTLLTLAKRYIVHSAMDRWEKEFWIDLPVATNPVDQAFLEAYQKSRPGRKARLFTLWKALSEEVERLKRNGKVPPMILSDPAFQEVGKQVNWFPTRGDLLYDMTIKAARDPSRFYFVFHPAAHPFYRQHYELLFPPQEDAEAFGTADQIPDDVFKLMTEDFKARHIITDAFIQNAQRQWDFYEWQLVHPVVEPTTLAMFPSASEWFAKWNPVTFKFTKCYYVKKITEDGLPRWEFVHPSSIDKQSTPEELYVTQPIDGLSIRRFEEGGIGSETDRERIDAPHQK